MVKRIRKVGNSNAIILDKALMELVGLQPGGEVNVQVNGTMICLSPVTAGVSDEQFETTLDEVMRSRKSLLRRLAQ